jgi:hypothetical protein
MKRTILTLGILVLAISASFGQGWNLTGATLKNFNNKVYLPYSNGNNYIRPATTSGFTYFDQGGVGIGHQNQALGFKLHVNGNTYLNGKVGIGTATPAEKLHVVGTARVDNNIQIGSAVVGLINIGVTPAQYTPGPVGGGGLQHGACRIDAYGDLNAGTVVPQGTPAPNSGNLILNGISNKPVTIGNGMVKSSKLTVNGKTYLEKDLRVNGNANLVNTGRLTFDGTQPNWNSWKTAISAPMGTAWVTTNKSNSGHFTGFGMTKDGFYYGRSAYPVSSSASDIKYMFKVDLNGKLTTREIEVSLTSAGGWPDFVFNEKYDLKPLSEVEKFIEANHHLPNVPSEKEVIENGINLGEMDGILLQKIEELTLYIIELEKKVEKNSNK